MDDNNILVFDVETTGISTINDQIIELAIQKGLRPGSEAKSRRFKPTIPIPPEATAVHGITDKDVADCPPFRKVAQSIREIFSATNVIVGYNVKFDLEMLQAEFKRAGVAPLDFSAKHVIDPYQLWLKCEPRKLEDAVKRFLQRDHTDAHSAGSDVAATGEILLKMLTDFGQADKSWEELADFTDPSRKQWLGPTHHLQWKKDIVVFAFGRHKDRCVCEVMQSDSSYLSWLSSKDFPAHVTTVLAQAVKLDKASFLNWAQSTYPLSK